MSVNSGAVELMGDDYASLYVLNPTDEEIARCEYYNDLDAAGTIIFNTLWQDVKNARQE